MSTPPLNPRSLLFTLYGDYVHPLGHQDVRVGALVQLAADLGVSDNALRSALSRMSRQGWLEAHRLQGSPRYRLSQRGRSLIEEGISRIYGRHRAGWDGRWLLVSYSLPERRRDQRDRLRQGLSFLGFGSLGNGLFVSPHDLRKQVGELIRRDEVQEHVTVHRGTLEWPPDAAGVVGRAWDLKELEGRYAAFLRRTGEALHESTTFDDRQAFRSRFLLTHEFRRFLFGDPDLPDALLPRGWVGGAARDAFFDYNRKLKRRAERYYLSLADDGTIVENNDRTMGPARGARGDR
jgi:phenylacetic acid degradation operon negative regulatory protein